MYNLRRTRDNAGDSGGSSQTVRLNEQTGKLEYGGDVPQVGYAVKVGSVTARSYSNQDWWMTTPVTEILEEIKDDKGHYIRFSTGNSEYEWWAGINPKK